MFITLIELVNTNNRLVIVSVVASLISISVGVSVVTNVAVIVTVATVVMLLSWW